MVEAILGYMTWFFNKNECMKNYEDVIAVSIKDLVETFTRSDVFSFSCRLKFSFFDGGGGGG